MEFRNLTPFSVMQYRMLDQQDETYHVVAMKVGFSLELCAEGVFQAQPLINPPIPLCLTDEYEGELNASRVLQENDLALFKPLCDVILNATVNAPADIPATDVDVGIQLITPEGQVLLDKRLHVIGERFLLRNSLTGQWSLSDPTPFTTLPLDYQYAFGGECRIEKESDAARNVPAKNQLTARQQAEHPQTDSPPLAHTVCVTNPQGQGYTERWYVDATRLTRVPAPQIMNPDHPFTLNEFQRCLDGRMDPSAPEFQPAGTGFLARSWEPRLRKAGTYNQHWLDSRHPGLPGDFDFGYWNGAPLDQQIPWPSPGLRFELQGLHPKGRITVQTPPHRAAVLLRMTDGTLIPQWMNADTLILDLDKMTLSITWRYLISTHAPIRFIEARYVTNPVQEEK